jgi:orotidine-5'-phosphate decarboxylase
MKARYRGPGDTVELDGLSFKKGEEVEVTREQYARMVASDPEAVVDVISSRGETAEEVKRIREAQARTRERGIKALQREAATPDDAVRAASDTVPAGKKGAR